MKKREKWAFSGFQLGIYQVTISKSIAMCKDLFTSLIIHSLLSSLPSFPLFCFHHWYDCIMLILYALLCFSSSFLCFVYLKVFGSVCLEFLWNLEISLLSSNTFPCLKLLCVFNYMFIKLTDPFYWAPPVSFWNVFMAISSNWLFLFFQGLIY